MKKASELFDGSDLELLPMTLSEAIDVLEKHNVWRLGAEAEPTNPKLLTEAIEIAIHLLKQMG